MPGFEKMQTGLVCGGGLRPPQKAAVHLLIENSVIQVLSVRNKCSKFAGNKNNANGKREYSSS